MRIPAWSVTRPVAVVMILLIVTVLGGLALLNLPLEFLPRMTFPVAAVLTRFSGASPQEVEDLVTRPLEEAMATLQGVKNVRSESREGASMVMVEFAWGTDMDRATLQMRERVDQVRSFLPDEAGRPNVVKFDPSLMPVLVVSLSGLEDPAAMRRLADEVVKPRLERLDGVASVLVTGGRSREVTVAVDPRRLEAHGLTLEAVVGALRARNLNVPGGRVERGREELLLRTEGELRRVEELALLPVGAAAPGGEPVRLGDVAAISDGLAEPDALARLDGKPAVSLAVRKDTDANALQVSRVVNAELARLRAELPDRLRTAVFFDEARFLRQSVANLTGRAVEGAVLAVLVIYFFLRHLRTTLVVAIAIPVSLLGAFALIFFSGMTLNMITLGGLALGVGRLVDDAIVVLENVFRHREEGRSPAEAAATGGGEILPAVTGVTLTTVAVFVPIVFVRGLVGEIFREMALAVSFALIASLVVAATAIPMLAARLLAGGGRRGAPVPLTVRGEADPAGFAVSATGGGRRGAWLRLQEFYGNLVTAALRRRGLVVGATVLALAASVAAVPLLGAQFLPTMDEGQLAVEVELPRGSALAETDRVVRRVEGLVRSLPEVEDVLATVGSAGEDPILAGEGGSRHQARVEARLVEKARRQRSTEQVMEDLRRRLLEVPGARFRVVPAGGMGSSRTERPIQVSVRGDDPEVLNQLGRAVEDLVRRVPGTREVQSSVEERRPELLAVPDQDRAGRLGLSVATLGEQVHTAVAGTVATRLRLGGEEVDVRVRLEEGVRRDPEALASLPLAGPGGRALLGDVVTLERGLAQAAIQRDGQARVVLVTAEVSGRSLGEVAADVRAALRGLALPPGYEARLGGEQEDMAEAFRTMGWAVLAAILLVYMILAAEFESLLAPLAVMVSVPLGLIGAVLGLLLTGRPLDVTALIGFLMLSGIAVSNGIILVDYIILLRRRGLERSEAVRRAGMVRLRPVLMTALATILGLIPLALGIGEGAEFQASMATVALFGLAVSTVLTLVVLPVIYSLLDDLALRLTAGRRATSCTAGEA